MKKINLLVLLAILFAACNDQTKFVVKGNVQNVEMGTKVYLYGFSFGNMVPIDSTLLSDKGDFVFNRPGEEDGLYRIILKNKGYMISAKNGDEIELKADYDNFHSEYTLTGNDASKKLTELNEIRNKFNARVAKISEDFEQKITADPSKRELYSNEILPIYNAQLAETNQQYLKFALDNSESMVGFYAVSLVGVDGNEAGLIEYAEKIKGQFKGNKAVEDFVARMTKLKTVQVGQIAPDFKSKSLDGAPVSLADFKGKYVLLDFWASWCQPCRQENPSIVKAYNKFKDKNFTILGISLDKDIAAWKGAIYADKLTWAHAGDLNDFEGATPVLYQIEAIPSSFLLDPDGRIIAKNLRGEELDAFLGKTLK